MSIPRFSLIILFATSFIACGNPFAPEKTVPDNEVQRPPAEDATTPQVVMDNLERAFSERDKELYETLLDDAYWFTETDCQGDLVLANGKEEELAIMGSRDGSNQGIFDIFRNIEWDFQQSRRFTELGRDFPNAFEGDPDGHPDEDWEVFRGRVEILLLESEDEGFRVNQVMNFKLKEGTDGLWRIVRWVDDPLVGDCGDAAGKSTDSRLPRVSWGEAKAP
ncbi:MAG: hypothetical protein VX733_02865 [Candidatus Latescibacterota bacterium]|nr:hypothetical protein [Candidatus Latescibacterota bacterium]